MTAVLLVLAGWALAAALVAVVLSRALRVRDARDARPGGDRDRDVLVDLTSLCDEPGGPLSVPRTGPSAGQDANSPGLPRTG